MFKVFLSITHLSQQNSQFINQYATVLVNRDVDYLFFKLNKLRLSKFKFKDIIIPFGNKLETF